MMAANVPALLIEDDHHGWLQVPLRSLHDAHCMDKISKYSYLTVDHVYLEKQEDMPVFLREAMFHGLQVTYQGHKTYEGQASLREYRRYDPALICRSYDVGDALVLSNEQEGHIAYQDEHYVRVMSIHTDEEFVFPRPLFLCYVLQ